MEKKVDRRIQKTRQQLAMALVDLMVEQGYENTTVQHILDRAKVGRSTFYVHFRDKEDLLRSSMDNMRLGLEHHWRASLEATNSPMGNLAFALPHLQHLGSHKHIWRAIVGRECGAIVDRQMRKILGQLARKDLSARGHSGLELDAAVQHVVGSLMSMIEWWLDHEIRLSPEELNTLFLKLTLPGLSSP